ncbi:hypothetical protein BOX15_Mlig018783g1, partial [Macrostomum lignano]
LKMGKNKKDKKKGHGAEKTAAKTERKAAKKASKAAKTAGEDDVAAVIAQLEAEEAAKWRPLMELTEPANGDSEFRPSPRSNFSWTANSRRSEIYLFGGEQRLPETGRLKVLNEHLVYRPVENRWIRLGGGTLPTPRCAHQATMAKPPSGSGDHLFVFGGEFATPTESQFHHYDDIWSWTVKSRQWRKVTPASGSPAPCPRSGHRMLALKRPQVRLLVFGGFHDNGRTFRYFNDLWSFDLDTRVWTEIRTTGSQPSPRSACLLFPLPDDSGICLVGGYAKRTEKRGEKGLVHTDCFTLSLVGRSSAAAASAAATDDQLQQFAWQPVKFSGQRPTPRCGVTGAVNPSTGRAYTFGGVFDIEQADDGLTGVMFNELYQLDLVKQRWRLIDFGSNDVAAGGAAVSAASILPLERINAGLAVLDDRLYLYGGIYEGDDEQQAAAGVGERSRILDDLQSLELKHLSQGWSMILPPTAAAGYQSDESESSDEDAGEEEAEDEDEEEATEADDGHEATPPPPPVVAGESVESYSTRTDSYWSRAVGNSLRRCWPASDVTESLVAKYAKRAARDFYRQTAGD